VAAIQPLLFAARQNRSELRYVRHTPRGRKIAIVTLGNAQWPVLRRYVDRVVAAVDSATPGSFAEVEIPFE
jgi:hypothetical protein